MGAPETPVHRLVLTGGGPAPTRTASMQIPNPESTSPLAPKKIIKRYMPDHQTIRQHRHLQIFGHLLHDPNLWHLNRRSVSGAFAVGLFNAFVPVPFQMVLAAAGAILFRVNLPIAVGLVWVTNPITMPPIFYFAYVVGTWILGAPVHNVDFAISWTWLSAELVAIWRPFLLGCFICGALSAAGGYGAMRAVWRFMVIRDWRMRALRRRTQSQNARSQDHPPS